MFMKGCQELTNQYMSLWRVQHTSYLLIPGMFESEVGCLQRSKPPVYAARYSWQVNSLPAGGVMTTNVHY